MSKLVKKGSKCMKNAAKRLNIVKNSKKVNSLKLSKQTYDQKKKTQNGSLRVEPRK